MSKYQYPILRFVYNKLLFKNKYKDLKNNLYFYIIYNNIIKY